MRGSRTLLVALGVVASVGLLVEFAAPAAGFTLGGSTSGSTSGTTSGVQTGITTAATEDVSTALLVLAAGGKTLGGPSVFFANVDGDERIYQVLTGVAPNLCITVRNLSTGQVRVSVNNAISTDVDAGKTLTSCYAAPMLIDLRCRQGGSCQAVWRIDRQA
jgi:hypothetical protein